MKLGKRKLSDKEIETLKSSIARAINQAITNDPKDVLSQITFMTYAHGDMINQLTKRVASLERTRRISRIGSYISLALSGTFLYLVRAMIKEEETDEDA